MATVNLGRVQPIYRGAYNAAVVYTPLDFVTFNDKTYFCIQTTTAGIDPTDATFWQLLADADSAAAINFNPDNSDLTSINVQDAIDELDGVARDASSLTTGTISTPLFQTSQIVTLGNSFDGINNAHCVRIGNIVTVQFTGLTWPSASFASSSPGAIPVGFRPGSFYGASMVIRNSQSWNLYVYLQETGTVNIESRNWSGQLVNTVGIGLPFALTYVAG